MRNLLTGKEVANPLQIVANNCLLFRVTAHDTVRDGTREHNEIVVVFVESRVALAVEFERRFRESAHIAGLRLTSGLSAM
jgi:hypothetical protein